MKNDLLLRRGRRRRYNLIGVGLLCATCVGNVDAVSVRQSRQEDEEESTRYSFQRTGILDSPVVRPSSQRFEIRLPSQFSDLADKARSKESSFATGLETEEIPVIEENVLEVVESSQITRPPHVINGGFILIGLASLAFTNHSAGFQPLRDLMSGCISALALVWLPVILFQGGWVELFSLISLLTQPTVRSIVVKELLPRALGTLKKLFLTEVWRRVWALVLAPLPKPLFVPSDEDIDQITWLPGWAKTVFKQFQKKVDTFVLSSIKTSTQKSVYETMGIVYDNVANSMLEVSILYGESTADDDSAKTAASNLLVQGNGEAVKSTDQEASLSQEETSNPEENE